MMVGMWNGTTVTGHAADLAHESAIKGLLTAGLRRQAGGNHDPLGTVRRRSRFQHPAVVKCWTPICLSKR
jgi:hypothetical protein